MHTGLQREAGSAKTCKISPFSEIDFYFLFWKKNKYTLVLHTYMYVACSVVKIRPRTNDQLTRA